MTISPLVFGLTAQLSKQRAQLSFGQGHSRCLEITSCIIFLIHTEISMHSSDPSGPRIIIIHIIHSMGISTTSGLSHRLDGICLVHIWARTILPKKKRLSELWCEKSLVSYIIPLTHTAKPSILCSATHGVGCVRGLCEFCRFMTKDCSSGEAIDHVRIIFKQLKITHG